MKGAVATADQGEQLLAIEVDAIWHLGPIVTESHEELLRLTCLLIVKLSLIPAIVQRLNLMLVPLAVDYTSPESKLNENLIMQFYYKKTPAG